MRILQHISLCTVMLLSLPYAAVSQATVSDAKLEGLKGQVRSVVSTGKAVSGYTEWVLKDKTKYQTTSLYNREGERVEEIYEGSSTRKYVYSKVDGYKTFKSIELKAPEKTPPRVRGGWASSEKEEPIEPNEKLTEPDKRFDFKYVYETDKSGRVIAERQYENNGRLFRKRTFQYDQTGILTKETEEYRTYVTTHDFTYDDRGNVVEVNRTRHFKGSGSRTRYRITYTDLKFDAVGNWTERKSTNYSVTDPMPQSNIPAQTYTLVDMQFRTITYY